MLVLKGLGLGYNNNNAFPRTALKRCEINVFS